MPTIATAGHVDHGKSTLVKALCGQDPDRLAEEKARGLTINLGFAWMELNSGQMLAFVDVPGHQKFITNMLSGVGPVKSCLFVVSALEEMMPQSYEHLEIMKLLDFESGVIAMTNAAAVEQSQLDSIKENIRSAISDSFLESGELVFVDSVTGIGIEELKTALNNLIENTAEAQDFGTPRLWVDRSFSAVGSGTVVTGTLGFGSLKSKDSVLEMELWPGPKSLRVRSIQSLGQTQTEAAPGTRVALNLSGISKESIMRGNVLVQKGEWFSTNCFDASIKVLNGASRLSKKGAHLVYLGSGDFPASISVLGARSVGSGEEGFIRVKIKSKLPLRAEDSFVLRDAGRKELVGGGKILDLDPVLPASKAHPDLSVERVLLERGGWMTAAQLKLLTGKVLEPAAGDWVALPEVLEKTKADLMARLKDGVELADLADQEAALLEELKDVVIARGKARLGENPASVGHPYLDALNAALFSPPAPEGLIDRSDLKDLVQSGLVVRSEGIYFSAGAISQAKKILAAMIESSPQGVTVAEIRNQLGSSRKFTLGLLAYLDETGATRRRGDYRLAGPRLKA